GVSVVGVVATVRGESNHVVEIMAEADRVAGVVAGSTHAITRFLPIPLVAEHHVVLPGEREGRVVEDAVALGKSGDQDAVAAAATVRLDRTGAGRAAQLAVALPHVVAFKLRLN